MMLVTTDISRAGWGGASEEACMNARNGSGVFAAALIGALAPLGILEADVTPGWSVRFAGAGFTRGLGERGPVCLLAHGSAGASRLYVGGEFTAIGGEAYRSIAAYDGENWSHVRGLVSEFGAESVAMMTEMPIGGTARVVVAGQFAAPGTSDGLGYIDGEGTVRAMPPGPRSPHAWFGSAFAWESPSGPELTLGSGIFPEGSDYIYRYTPEGYGLMPPGLVTIARAFAVFDDGAGRALYIGEQRNGAGPDQTVTKWDGGVLTSLPAGAGWVNALCVYDGGDGAALYAGGVGMKRYRDGAWEPVAGAPSFGIFAMKVFDDGSGPALYVAGQFAEAGGHPAANIARFRHGVWEALGAGLTGGEVMALEVFDEGGPAPAALFAAGTFTQAGGVSSPGIARWGAEYCRADYNVDGATDSRDFFEFLGAFFGGAADFNRDGATDSQDFLGFLAAFFGGC
jgi:hypothetical protein